MSLENNAIHGIRLSGNTIISGTTDLSLLFAPTSAGPSTFIQGGLNTYTGGTPSLPTINISAATLNSLFSTTLSGGTIYSGSTPLSTIITNLAPTQTYIQPGINTYTGGTSSLPTVNISALTITNITVTGISIFNTITANTVSGGTIYSGSTNVSSIFAPISVVPTYVQPGLNTYTGGTSSLPTINISALTISNITSTGSATFNTVFGTSISGGTIYSGNTELGTLFTPSSTGVNLQRGSFGITIDGQGGVITTGSKGYIVIPYVGTITKWYIVSDQSGSTVVDLKRSSTSIIGTGNTPTLTSQQRNNSNVSGWTSTAVSINDEMEFVVNSATSVTRVNLIIEITKT